MQFRSSASWKLRLFHVGSYVGTSITLEYIVRFFSAWMGVNYLRIINLIVEIIGADRREQGIL